MPRKAMEVEMDVTELLHEDHQKVRDLFFLFDEAEDDKEKEMLVQEILTELHIHSTLEEEIVYPVVEHKAQDGGELVDEAEVEHKLIKFMMAELSEMTAKDDQFDAKVTVLCEVVGHHVHEEEKEMFKKLRDSGADLKKLAKQFEARKMKLIDQPMPKMESSLSIVPLASKRKAA